MIDGRKLLWRLRICTSCYKAEEKHCPKCWACSKDHICDRKELT